MTLTRRVVVAALPVSAKQSKRTVRIRTRGRLLESSLLRRTDVAELAETKMGGCRVTTLVPAAGTPLPYLCRSRRMNRKIHRLLGNAPGASNVHNNGQLIVCHTYVQCKSRQTHARR
jgi:hypothetical protein